MFTTSQDRAIEAIAGIGRWPLSQRATVLRETPSS